MPCVLFRWLVVTDAEAECSFPTVVWRRTGEIFKGNREFASLVGIPYEQLRDGKLAIYELMTEDSAVNFWEVMAIFPINALASKY
jgi:hypothetical protein